MPSSKKNSDIQYKAAPQGMVNLDEAEGIVECFVAGIGNKDSVGDVCAPGAFGKSLIRRKPRVVWGHNWNDPIGKVLDMYEVPPSDPRLPGKMKAAGIGGLYARVQFNLKSEKGREAFANVAFFGEEQEWSIGYKTINAKFDPQMQANILYEVELYEVSPVLHGANQLTGTISIKSEDQSSAVLVNEQPSIDGLTVNELSSVLDALKTIASSTDEKCGPGMPMGTPMVMPSAPKPMQTSAPRDVVKPEVPSMPENPMLVAIRRELASRTGANIIVRSAAGNTVLFDRITSDGVSSTYKLPFHYMNGEFMFGKPEKVNVQATPESSAPEMPGMPQQFGGYEATTAFDAGKSLISFDDAQWGEGFGQQIPAQQVDVSTLNSVISNLEKIIEEKSTYIISVDIENMFQVKQAIDPVLDYYRVDATVTEDGIIVKSLDSEFLDAMDIATKGVLRSIGNMVDRAVDRPSIGGGRNRRDRNPNLASRGRGIGSRGAVVRLSDGTMWDPKNAPDRNNNGIVGEGLTDGRGMSLSQPDPTPDGPDSVGAPKTPGVPNVNKTPKEPKRTAVVLDDVKPLPKRTMTTAPGTPPKRTAMTTAPGTPPKRTTQRLSSGDKTWVELADEEAGNNPKALADFLIDRLGYEEDHPTIKKLRNNNTNDDEFEKVFEQLAVRDAEDADFYVDESDNPETLKALRDLGYEDAENILLQWDSNEVGQESYLKEYGTGSENRSENVARAAAQMFEDYVSDAADRQADRLSSGGKWKGEKPTDEDIKPGADLSGADLRGVNLYGADLEGVNLDGANMESAYLSEANLEDASLSGANLSGINMAGANLRDATLGGADLSVTDLRGADLRGAVMDGADLTGADLRKAKLGGVNFRQANLFEANLLGADLRRVDLRGANLRGADLRDADLSGVDLRGADMDGAKMDGADLTGSVGGGRRLSSGEWTKNTDGYEMDAPDIEGVYDVYKTDDGKFIVTRYSDYNRNGGQDAQEYEHDKEFSTLAAAKKWVEKDYAEASNEYGEEDVEIREVDTRRRLDNLVAPELPSLDGMDEEEAEEALQKLDDEMFSFVNETEKIARQVLGDEEYNKRFGGAVPLIEEMSKDHDGSVSERDTALEIALDRAEKFNASINRALNEDNDRLSSGRKSELEEAVYEELGSYDGDTAWDYLEATYDIEKSDYRYQRGDNEYDSDDKSRADLSRAISELMSEEDLNNLLQAINEHESSPNYDIYSKTGPVFDAIKAKKEYDRKLNNEDGDRMSSGLLQTIAQNPTTYAILGGYIWGMAERRNREDSYDDDFGDDEDERLSSGRGDGLMSALFPSPQDMSDDELIRELGRLESNFGGGPFGRGVDSFGRRDFAAEERSDRKLIRDIRSALRNRGISASDIKKRDPLGAGSGRSRFSSGKIDFDKKGASGLREMRHAERNPLRYDSPEDKAARDSYEETVANFIKNNGWFVEVPMYNGDPKWQNEDWYRAREFATNVAKLRFEDDYLNGFMQVFDKPGKPSKKDFFAKKGTVDYKSWYVNKTTQITSDIDNVLKSDQYSDNFKESYMNAVRSFLYVNRPEFGPYASDDSVKAYDAWLQQAGLGWGGRYSNSGPSLDDMRLSSGARTGSKKDNYIQSYDNPQDLKEAMFAELIANNMNDYEGMTAEDLAYALNVRSVHVEPLLDEVKKDITQAMDDYELYLDSRPEMTDEEMYAMANDFARGQTVTDKFADMTDEEAADYAAYMEEETWGDRLSSGAKGKTPEERITNFHNDMAKQGAIEEKFDIDNARSFDEMSSEEQLDLFESVSERLSETNPSALEDLEAGGLSIDEYLSEYPRFHPDFPSKDTDNTRFSSGRTFAPPKPRRAPRKGEEGLLDILETLKGNAGSDWANGFVESVLDQNVKFRGKLTDSQWDNIARIVREKGSTVAADAPKTQKGPRLAKYAGKRRKIVGLDEVEAYDYPGVEFKPNAEQSDAIDAMMTGSDVKVGALAATGKTTTVISFANRLRAQDPTARVAYLVFNRAAKDDAIDRGMGDNVSVMTMDGITHKAMIGNSGMPGLRPGLKNKMYDEGKASIDESVRSFKGKAAYLGIRGAFIPREDDAPLELTPTDIYKIVAKGIDAYAISADDAIGPQHFTGAFNGNLAIPEDSPIMSDVLKYANKMWEDLQQDRDNLKKQGMLDFSANHLTKMWALTGPDVGSFAGEDGVNVIMIDEAQDINPVFAKMMKEAQSAQKIYIGDTNQAINAWRGADGSTLDAVEAEYDMPITESYRFGAKIAGIGNRFLTLLGVKERMTGKKTKAGKNGSRVDVPGEVKEIDAIDATMILCRSNGGAIAATMEVITQSNGKKKVYGSANFKKDLQNFIDNIEWMQNSAAGDPHWTNSYGKRQTDRPEFSADLEGITTIEEFNKEVASGDNNRLNMLDGLLKKHSIEELREALDGILTKKEDVEKLKPEDYVKIQTAHTSKGLESGKVKIWSDFRKPKLDEETGEYIYPNQQELRLSYVAVTRAEEEIDLGSLSWITDHTVDADELPNPPSDRLSSGAYKKDEDYIDLDDNDKEVVDAIQEAIESGDITGESLWSDWVSNTIGEWSQEEQYEAIYGRPASSEEIQESADQSGSKYGDGEWRGDDDIEDEFYSEAIADASPRQKLRALARESIPKGSTYGDDAHIAALRESFSSGERLSSGRSVTRRQGSGKNSRARGQRPWSDEDRQAFADGDKLRAQTVPGKRRQGPSAGEFSSGARFTPDGESGSRLQRRLSSGDYYGPPPTGSGKYDSEIQIGAVWAVFHTDPGTAVIPSDMSGVLGPVPNGRQSHVLNAAAAKKIIDNPDMEYSADNGWPVDAGKLLDFIKVNEPDAIRTLREIGDSQRIATILGIPESDAKDMLDGKPVYIVSSTAANMFDSLQASGNYPAGVRGLNDVARVWGFDGAPKWVRMRDLATPEYDLNEDGDVNWSIEKWVGLSREQFDAEVSKGKVEVDKKKTPKSSLPEPVYTSPVEFFNGDAIASNPKWDARGGSFKNPTVDSEFSVAPKKLSRAEQLEPTRMPSQARVGERTAMADKDFAGKWIKRGHGVSAENMMDILGIKRDSEGETTTSDIKKLLVALNDIREKAGLPLIGNDGEFRPATISETKNKPMSDDVMHALVASGKFKSMKEVVAALGDPRLDSLASEYDSRMLVDAALIRIKDKMNKDGVPDSNKIIAKAMTTALGRKTDIEARVKEGRVSIKGEMKEDGMIGDAKIAEILESVNETLARSGYPEISQDELFPKDETGGYVDNLSSTIPGATRMSSGQRFIARTSSSRRADAMNDAATRRENTSSRLSSGASLPLQDEDGKIVPGNIEQAAREAVPSGDGIDNALMIQRKTPQKNLEEFEKAVKLRQEISNLFTANRKNTQGFTVYDFQEELTKAGFSLEEAEKMVDSVADLDMYIDDVESHFDDARSVMSDSIEEIDDSLNKVERLQKEKANIIKQWGESDGEVLLAVINDKISNEMAKIDKAYQRGLGGDEGQIGALHPQVEKLLRDMPGWSDRWNGPTSDINKELLDIEMAISKAGGMKKAVAITGIDFGVPEGTRLSSGRADEYYQNLTSHLINMIEKSQKEGGKWDAPWHRAGNIPRNASTKNMYSGGNLFALMLASEEKGYTTPQWAGFQQWKKLGGTVRKGEKATVILIPRQLFGEEIDDNGVKIRKSKGVSFSTAHVFNFDQIDGIDREEFLKTPTDALTPEQRVGKLEDAIKEIGATIKTGDGSRAYYSPREDHVVMPPFELFKSPEGYYGTLAHELVHWTGHSSRLDRKNMNQFGSPDYAREELVAEFGSAFLLAMFDLSAEPREDHAHYLASWLKVLREEPNALQEASIKAQAASKLLIEKMKAVLAEMGEPVSDAESVVDVKSLQIFNDPLYEVKDAYIEWSRDPFNAPFLVKSLDAQKHSSGLVNRSWERIAETAIFLERLSRRKK